jgi:hypothetical protein
VSSIKTTGNKIKPLLSMDFSKKWIKEENVLEGEGIRKERTEIVYLMFHHISE